MECEGVGEKTKFEKHVVRRHLKPAPFVRGTSVESSPEKKFPGWVPRGAKRVKIPTLVGELNSSR